MDSCPVCGEKAVKVDVENGQRVRVCIECGAIDSDMQELTSEDQFQGTTVTDGTSHGPQGRRGWSRDSSSYLQKNKRLGTKLIANIGSQLHLGEGIIAEACHLYETVHVTGLHHTHQDTKKATCLACLYASARMNGVPVNIRVLGFFLNIKDSARKFAAALKNLKEKHDVHLPPVNIESETWAVLAQSDLSSEVVKTTQQLMLIMQRAMLTSGRCSMSIVVPCAYFAYKASDVFKNKKLSFIAFCEKFGFPTRLRYLVKREVQNILKAMAKELPWMKGRDNETEHVELYVKDIIRYQSSLLAQAIQTAVNKMDEVNEDEKKVGECIHTDPSGIFRKFPKRSLEQEKLDTGRGVLSSPMKKQAKLVKKEGNESDCVSAGNSSGLESFDLGSDDDTDQYIIPLHEVILKKEVKKKYGLPVEEDKTQECYEEDVSIEKHKNVERKHVNDCYKEEKEFTDTEEDGDKDCSGDEDKHVLLKRQSNGTADDVSYSDEDYN